MGKRGRRYQRHLAALPDGPDHESGAPVGATAPNHTDALVAAVVSGLLDTDLERVVGVVTERLSLLHAARSMAVMASLKVGDRVRVNCSARPLYLHGSRGTITGWAGQRVVVRLDQPVGRFVKGEVRCPPTVLEPAGAE